MNKVPLKSDEETVRGHICALLACEKLREKQMARSLTSSNDVTNGEILQYYTDRIPLQPKKINHLVNVFKQNISQCSPVKQIQWSPSPKKSRSRSQLSSPTKSPVKTGHNKFTSQDPNDLRRMLFDGSPKKTPTGKLNMNISLESPTKSALSSPRRKLKFEMVDDDDEEEEEETTGTEAESREGSHPPKRNLSEDISTIEDPFVSNKKPRQTINRKSYERNIVHNLLMKKYNKVSPADVINLCNKFELPQKVSYTILDFFMVNQSYLVCPWQLICGLVLHCTFIVFNDKRRKDPRLNHLLLEKMMDLMRCDAVEEISECFNVVSELILGEKWYRDLEVEYNYFSGFNYEESIIIKLGSMLQTNTILFSDDQYENWKKNVMMDLSLKHDK